MFEYKRSDRVGDQLRSEIADILARKVKDPRIGFITVTSVDISNDLRNAKIYVSFLDEGAEEKKILQGLEKASGFIRSELGKRLRLKYLPKLLFSRDLSAKYSDHISRVLEEIKLEDETERS